ncbi:hypothetical protein [Phenylobacterium sp. LjRoot225]|uniref:hypothetical protein n=1 Tax=Phenylobacterium sp. LjRoot225 TaxID=3342285 RepID=UPI003F509D4C
MPSPILQPIVALVLWSFVMWAWLYATRIPAIQAAGAPMKPEMTAADLTRCSRRRCGGRPTTTTT